MSEFKNKVVLVTGAGSGIGKEIVKHFANEGAKVIILGRNINTLRESAAQHENIIYQVADLGTSSQISDVISRINVEFGKLDLLINNAGWAPVTPLGQISLEEYESAFTTNVKGVLDITQQALPLLLESKGSIQNISSTAAIRPISNMSIYSASKAAMSAFTKAWAQELATKGIRVNNVVVGPIETPIYDKSDLNDKEAKAHHERVQEMIPLGEFGQPINVVSVVAFLASKHAKFITGADFAVDGGVLAK